MASNTGARAAVIAIEREIAEIKTARKEVEQEITETKPAIKKVEALFKKAEAQIMKVEAQINKVEATIEKDEAAVKKVQADVEKVEVELSEVDAQLQSPDLSANKKAALNKKEQRLRTKEQQLSTDLQQLRTKEQQLRTKEQQLRADLQQLRTDLQQLRTKEERLRTKEEQLRTKDEQLGAMLLTKEQQLRTKEEQLRTKEQELRNHLTGPELYLKRALMMNAPSLISLKREQMDPVAGPLINSWRPTLDTAGGQLPELTDPVFAKAVESMADGKEVDQASIDTAATLCCIGANIYDNEAGLTKAVRSLLEPYLEDEKVVTISSGFAENKVSPDWALGDSPKDPSNLFLIVEVTPGIGGSGDPHFQGANYLLHFWRQRSESDVFRNTYCPAFLLEVVGPHVRLSAVAWLNRVTIFPLTPLLNLLPAHPVTDCLLMPVARMLAALRTGVRELAAVHAHMVAAHAVEAHAAPAALQQPATANKEVLPWPILMNPRYDKVAVIQLAPRNPTYYVRLASSSDDEGSGGRGGVKAVAVKLCRKYGLAAHRAWAELGLAPRVQHWEELLGGWQLVEMEWLPGPEWQRLSDLQGRELGEALGAVEEALEIAHRETGMVHGDMRPPNCLVQRDTKVAGSWQVRFVDFEWAGLEGEATYPAFLNPNIPWPEGVGYGKQLLRTHDVQLLATSTTRLAAGDGHGAAGPGVVRSLRTAPRDRCIVPLRKAAGVMLHWGVGVGWQQRATAGWLRPTAPGRRLVW